VEELATLLKARLHLIMVSRIHVLPGVDPTNAQVMAISSFNPQAPAGSAIEVHTEVFRGVEARDQHRIWA